MQVLAGIITLFVLFGKPAPKKFFTEETKKEKKDLVLKERTQVHSPAKPRPACRIEDVRVLRARARGRICARVVAVFAEAYCSL